MLNLDLNLPCIGKYLNIPLEPREIKLSMTYIEFKIRAEWVRAAVDDGKVRNLSGFDLTTRDSYFKNQVEVFTSHILVENTYFTNHSQ